MAIILSLLLLTITLQLWKSDIGIPFSYSTASDVYLNSLFIKTAAHGWSLHNPYIGAPTGADLQDYPYYDSFHFLVFKFLSLWTQNFGRILNVYFLLTFPLTAISALFVFRKFGVSDISSIFGSLIYAFLPYHFLHGELHIFLASYFAIPLIVMMLIWLVSGETLFSRSASGKIQITQAGYLSVAICLLTGILNAGLYYSFFAGYLLVIAVLLILLRTTRRKNLKPALLLLGILIFTSFINILPSVIFSIQNGLNSRTLRRTPSQAETYSLKPTGLVLPITDHRITALRELKQRFIGAAKTNESDWTSLGMISGFGFLFLILSLLTKPRFLRLVPILAAFNIAALLLGTLGGFGSLFSLLVSPIFRGYARISIFIGFFSIFAIVLLLDRLKSKLPNWLYAFFILILLVFGIFDQTSPAYVPDYKQSKQDYENDEAYIKSIETFLPARSMIFQIPLGRWFPNPGGPLYQMKDYDFLRGYLHSDKLRWSYGAVQGRGTDYWQKGLVDLDAKSLAKLLSFAGFRGIYLDRCGYPDTSYEQTLTHALGKEPFVSKNQRFVFFDLRPYTAELIRQFTAEEWHRNVQQVWQAKPVLLAWSDGFSDKVQNAGLSYRACGPEGLLSIENRASETISVRIEMMVGSVDPGKSELSIKSQMFSDLVPMHLQPQPYSRVISLPPGTHTITFSSNASPPFIPYNAHPPVFRVYNFRIENADPQSPPLRVITLGVL